jgi:hypothetical protein
MKNEPELCEESCGCYLGIQIVVSRSGIIDKMGMYEADVWHEICYMGKVFIFFFSL